MDSVCTTGHHVTLTNRYSSYLIGPEFGFIIVNVAGLKLMSRAIKQRLSKSSMADIDTADVDADREWIDRSRAEG